MIENGLKVKLEFFRNFFLPTSVVFSGWHICIWLTSIAIQIFKYAANFGIASWTFFSASSDVVIALPVNYTIWVIFQVQGSLSFSNRTSACLAKPCLRMLEKFETKLFLLLRLFLWLRHSVEIHVQSYHLKIVIPVLHFKEKVLQRHPSGNSVEV